MTMGGIRSAFEQNGYYAPFRVLPAERAARTVARYDAMQQQMQRELGEAHRFKLHLLAGWLAEIVCNPTILDLVEEILGPNILCWSSDFFVKPAHNPSFVSWHQDTTYAGLSPPDGIVNLWVALTPSNTASGCLQVVPGSHKLGQLAHNTTRDPENLLFFGQTAELEDADAKGVNVELAPGEASLHHMALVHGSRPNRSDRARIGLVLRYIRPDVVQSKAPDSATLVRGRNIPDHFALEPLPEKDWSAAAVAAFKDAIQRPSALG